MTPAPSRWPFLTTMVWLAVVFSAGFGQPPDRSRSHGPIPTNPSGSAPNPAQLQQLAERLQDVQHRELEELFQKIKSNPQDLQKALEDPKVLQALAESIQNGQVQPSPEDAETLYNALKGLNPEKNLDFRPDPDLLHRLSQNLEKIKTRERTPSRVNPRDLRSPPGTNDSAKPKQTQDPSKPGGQSASKALTPPPLPPPQRPDQSNQSQPWVAQVQKWAENNRALQNSPSLRQALEDLAHNHLQGNSEAAGAGELTVGEKTVQWLGDRLPSERFWNNSVMPKVRNLPLPSLPNMDLPNIHFSTPSLPSLDVPSMGMPAPSSSGGETVFLSLFTVAVIALVLWKLLGGWLGRKGQMQGLNWAQGNTGSVSPRSLDLSSLTTRQDLIRAFEQLSLVKLGSAARSWNHLQLAANLGGKFHEYRQLANHLASLYEQARYAPGDGLVSPDALRIAHHELTILAGAANA